MRKLFSEERRHRLQALSEAPLPGLAGSKTEENLKAALADEGADHAKYLYAARVADAEGAPEVAALFDETANEEAAHANGTLGFLKGIAVGSSEFNIREAIKGETKAAKKEYPRFAREAKEEGFTEIAEWFKTLAKTEATHAEWFQEALDSLHDEDVEPPPEAEIEPEED